MNVRQLVKVLRKCPGDYKVGITIQRPDGDEFYCVENEDITLSSDTTDGDELPFGIVSLGMFKGDRSEE